MTSICVCNYRPQEIGVCNVATVRLWGTNSFFALLAVVEKLGQEEILDLVGNGILHLISTRNITCWIIRRTIG